MDALKEALKRKIAMLQSKPEVEIEVSMEKPSPDDEDGGDAEDTAPEVKDKKIAAKEKAIEIGSELSEDSMTPDRFALLQEMSKSPDQGRSSNGLFERAAMKAKEELAKLKAKKV